MVDSFTNTFTINTWFYREVTLELLIRYRLTSEVSQCTLSSLFWKNINFLVIYLPKSQCWTSYPISNQSMRIINTSVYSLQGNPTERKVKEFRRHLCADVLKKNILNGSIT